MATLTSQLLVKLVDGVSGPAREMAGAIGRIGDKARDVGGMQTRLQNAIARNNAALDTARGHLLNAGAAAAGLAAALGAPVNRALEMESALEGIGQKTGLSGSALDVLGKKMREVGRATNVATSDMLMGFDTLAGMGASADVATTILDPIGKATTAYKASINDLAAASWSAVDNLKVPADQVGAALDAMAQAGKAGAFELKDMASYFPSLGAAAQALGQEGVPAVADLAAALQIVRKGTGDASSAATNLQNVLQKIYAPATVRAFQRLGVNIRDEMAAAAEAGQTPIEAIAEITNRTLGGDLSKLGDLFEDAQAQGGLRSLIQEMDEFRRIREEALGAQGTVERDFSSRMEDAGAKMTTLGNAVENLSAAIGNSLLPAVSDVSASIAGIVDVITNFIDQHQTLVAAVLATTAAFVAFKIAMTGLTFVGLLGRGGALSMLALGYNTLGKAIIGASNAAKSAVGLQSALAAMSGAKFGGFSKFVVGIRGIAVALPGVSAISGALTAIGAAIGGISLGAAIGIGAAFAAIAGAGVLIWKYWDRITSVLGGFFGRLGEEFTPALEAAQPLFNWLGEIGSTIGDGFNAALGPLREFGKSISDFFYQETLTDEAKAAWANAGSDAARAMIDAIKAAFGQLLEWMTGIGARIASTISDGFSSGLSSVTGWFGGGGPAPTASGPGAAPYVPSVDAYLPVPGTGALSGHRATGGRVWPGSPFLVGENEPEVFQPQESGTVTPVSDMMAAANEQAGNAVRLAVEKLMGARPQLGPVSVGPFHITGVTDPAEVARLVIQEFNRSLSDLIDGAHYDVAVRPG